jgi:hypothetical protein
MASYISDKVTGSRGGSGSILGKFRKDFQIMQNNLEMMEDY